MVCRILHDHVHKVCFPLSVLIFCLCWLNWNELKLGRQPLTENSVNNWCPEAVGPNVTASPHSGDERAPLLQSFPSPAAWHKWLWGDRAWPLSRARVTVTRHTASPVSHPGPSLSAARLCSAQTASDQAPALTVWALCTMPGGRLEWGQHLQEPRFRLLTEIPNLSFFIRYV